jgi:hypothetical protein
MLYGMIISALGELRRWELMQEAEQIRRVALVETSADAHRGLLAFMRTWKRSPRHEARNRPVGGEQPS